MDVCSGGLVGLDFVTVGGLECGMDWGPDVNVTGGSECWADLSFWCRGGGLVCLV